MTEADEKRMTEIEARERIVGIEITRLRKHADQCRLNASGETNKWDKEAWSRAGQSLNRAAAQLVSLTAQLRAAWAQLSSLKESCRELSEGWIRERERLFALEAQVTTVRAEERERCCAAICSLCRRGVPMSSTKRGFHQPNVDYVAECAAAAIRQEDRP